MTSTVKEIFSTLEGECAQTGRPGAARELAFRGAIPAGQPPEVRATNET